MDGILLIHGFAGKTYELTPLYQYLSASGYMIEMPVLKGHVGERAELKKSTHADWIESVYQPYEKLREKCDRVFVIGFSMGGLIGAAIYEKYKFDKFITINTPIYYWPIKTIIKNLRQDYETFSKKYFYSKIPCHSLIEFTKMLKHAKPCFNNIKCPILIIQAKDDDVSNPKSANYIKNAVSGSVKVLCPQNGGHFVILTEHFDNIKKEITKFLEE